MNDNLTIKNINARAVIAPLVRPITTAHAIIPKAPLVLIDIECNEEITGCSYLFGYTPVSLKPIVELIASLNEILKGKSVKPIKIQAELATTFRLLGRQGILGMAIAGIDMALWDALAKSKSMSLAKMLGGSEDAFTCYDSLGVFNAKSSPGYLEQTLEQGFTAVKFKIGGGDVKDDIAVIKTIREIIGDDIKLMVDYNQSLETPDAINRVQHLAEFDLHWVEEPVRTEDYPGQAKVREASPIAIQTGENWWFAEDAAQAIHARVSDHAMLDIMKIGGFTGWAQAAAIAHSASLPVSSHIFIEASSHAMAANPNAHLLEYLDVASAVLVEPYAIKDGTLAPRGPGIGIAWDEVAVEKYGI